MGPRPPDRRGEADGRPWQTIFELSCSSKGRKGTSGRPGGRCNRATTLRTGIVGEIATEQLFQNSWVCKYLFGFFFREVRYDRYDGERIRAALAAFADYPGGTRRSEPWGAARTGDPD